MFNNSHEELRQFWRSESTSKVYLVKWPVSVYLQWKPYLELSLTFLKTNPKEIVFLHKSDYPARMKQEPCKLESGRWV